MEPSNIKVNKAIDTLGHQTPLEERKKLLINLTKNKYGDKVLAADCRFVDGYLVMKPLYVTWNCKQCGNCCIWTEAELYPCDIRKIKDKTGRDDFYIKDESSLTGYRIKHVNGKCIFLDENRKCGIYPIRPLMCKRFPFDEGRQRVDGRIAISIGLKFYVADGMQLCNGIEEGELDDKVLLEALSTIVKIRKECKKIHKF